MDADRIAGVRAKLDRADEHFEALTTAVRAYVDSQPNTYPIEADLSAGTYTVRIKINEFPPSRLAILCGDFIQNLRAALDHLANALVPEPSRRTGFPIFRSPQGFREKVRTPAIRGDDGLLTGLNPQGQIFAQIESLQPYHKAPAEIRTDPLACLADLSNTDKHRTILTTFSAHRHDPRQPTPDIDFDKATDVTFVGQAAFTYDKVLTDGDEVLRGEFVVTGPNPEPRIEGTLLTDVAFASDAAFGDDARPITTDGLASIRLAVRAVCDTLLENSRAVERD